MKNVKKKFNFEVPICNLQGLQTLRLFNNIISTKKKKIEICERI